MEKVKNKEPKNVKFMKEQLKKDLYWFEKRRSMKNIFGLLARIVVIFLKSPQFHSFVAGVLLCVSLLSFALHDYYQCVVTGLICITTGLSSFSPQMNVNMNMVVQEVQKDEDED